MADRQDFYDWLRAQPGPKNKKLWASFDRAAALALKRIGGNKNG